MYKLLCFLSAVFFSFIGVADNNLEININVKKIILPNKMVVLLHEDHSIPMISFHTWYKVGSRDEAPGYTGAAHMLEHMMFQGSGKYTGKESQRLLEKNGIDWNAFTSSDITGYYMNLPSKHLDLVLDIEFDRMKSLKLADENLKSELEVVKEERRMRIDNNPSGILYEKTMETVFQKSNYRWPVIGWMDDITNYKNDVLKKFYNRFYGPNNAVIVLAGAFSTDTVEKKITELFGKLPIREIGERTYPLEDAQKEARLVQFQKDVKTVSFNLAFPTVGEVHDSLNERFTLDVLASVLGAGSSSRLYRALVYEKKIALSVSSYHRLMQDQGLFVVNVQVKPGFTEKDILPTLNLELEKIRTSLVTESELKKAKVYVMKNAVDSLSTLDRKARSLASSEITTGDYRTMFTELKNYQNVKVADLKSVAQKYLAAKNRNLVVIEPKTENSGEKNVK